MTDINPQSQIEALWAEVNAMKTAPPLLDHYHNGFDVSRVNFVDIYQKKLYIYHTIPGLLAATATNYGVFLIVPAACAITGFKEVHGTAGAVNGTLTLEKLTGTQAADAGVAMLASTVSLTATANTVQVGTLTGTLANRSLVAGDRLCMKDGGTLTTVADVSVIVELTMV